MRKLRLNEIRRNAMLLAARRTSTAEERLKFTVSGTVEDEAEAALDGVLVTVVGTSLTDTSAVSTGAFSIASVPKGGRTLRFTKTGYVTQDVAIVVAGANLTVSAVTMVADE